MSKKDVGLRIRVERDLRDAFLEACKAEDQAASEILRNFMRQFSERYNANQGQLVLPLNKDK